MAASPRYKLYTADGEHVSSSNRVELLTASIALLGEGATIRLGNSRVLWTEGVDGWAGESHDVCAGRCYDEEMHGNLGESR